MTTTTTTSGAPDVIMTSKVCRTVSAGDIWTTLAVSLMMLCVLLYSVIEATQRFMNHESEQWPLAAMGLFALLVAQLACMQWRYIRDNCPRELTLLERYLHKGKMVIGDVHYPSPGDEPVCAACLTDYANKGAIFYRHPMPQYKGCFIRRDVHLVDKYTRELETLLILPGEPYSAQPKTDLEGMLAIGTSRNDILQVLGTYAFCLMVFAILSAVYMVFVMTNVDDQEDKGFWRLYLGWIVLSVTCFIVIPTGTQYYCRFKLHRYVEWFRKGNARFVQQFDDEYSTLHEIPSGVGAKKLPKEEI